MYGTIFNLNIKPGHEEALQGILEEQTKETPEGMTAWFVMNPDSENHWIGVAVFESKEAHVANAERPEQHEAFLKMIDHLESEPTWTDGSYVIGKIA